MTFKYIVLYIYICSPSIWMQSKLPTDILEVLELMRYKEAAVNIAKLFIGLFYYIRLQTLMRLVKHG